MWHWEGHRCPSTIHMWVPFQKWINETQRREVTCRVGKAEVWIHLRWVTFWAMDLLGDLMIRGKHPWKEWRRPTFWIWMMCYPRVPMAVPSLQMLPKTGRKNKTSAERGCPPGVSEKWPAWWHCSGGPSQVKGTCKGACITSLEPKPFQLLPKQAQNEALWLCPTANNVTVKFHCNKEMSQ